MSAALIPADPGNAWADLCAGAPFCLISPDDADAARCLAVDFIATAAPQLRGFVVETLAGARCYEMRWTDFGEGVNDLGRLCAIARPWRTVEALLSATGTPQDALYVLVFDAGAWAQWRVNDAEAAA